MSELRELPLLCISADKEKDDEIPESRISHKHRSHHKSAGGNKRNRDRSSGKSSAPQKKKARR